MRKFKSLVPLLGILAVLPPGISGQTMAVAVEENVRAEPGGQIIGRLQPGVLVSTGSRQGRWVEITFRGWVWTRSLQAREGGSFDLVVSAPQGENLRSGPQGEILGRLNTGTLLLERDRSPGWIAVERTAWFWSPSLTDPPEVPATARASRDPGAVSEAGPPASAAPPTGSPGESRPPGTPSGAPDWLRDPARASGVLSTPDGDTLALALPGTEMRVLSREGNWARVRLEGWVWEPSFDQTESVEAGPVLLTEVTPQSLGEDPEAFRGRVVSWEVQFISVERAEAIRTDFYEGEPFMLVRYGGQGGPFVYVAFPPDRLLEVEALAPLERVTVVGRVRNGRAALTGSPILDLLELRAPPGSGQ